MTNKTTKAEDILDRLSTLGTEHGCHLFTKDSVYNSFSCEDNNQAHDLLNDEMVGFDVIAGQDTWIMSDGSYITRSESSDLYFFDSDIEDFYLTAETCFDKDVNIKSIQGDQS